MRVDDTLVVSDEGVITVTGTTEDGDVIFILTFTPTLNADGSVTVVMSLDQKQPLDHLDADSIIFEVPIQITDTDGDKLVGSDGSTETPIDISVSFTDGEAPILTDTSIDITEADVGIADPQIYTGQVPTDIGSDTIASMQFVSDGQKGLLQVYFLTINPFWSIIRNLVLFVIIILVVSQALTKSKC